MPRAIASPQSAAATIIIIGPALAGIVGAGRECTALITSVLSVPCG
jgi:hypothetical protein